MRQMTASQLQEYLSQSETKPLLLDVREKWEFEICHLEGAVLMPTSQFTSVAHALDCVRETVVICHHGIRSAQVCSYLEKLGFTRLINLTGGMAAWSSEVDPSVPTY
jgi:rhodanese-related sulfurtransferase